MTRATRFRHAAFRHALWRYAFTHGAEGRRFAEAAGFGTFIVTCRHCHKDSLIGFHVHDVKGREDARARVAVLEKRLDAAVRVLTGIGPPFDKVPAALACLAGRQTWTIETLDSPEDYT